MLLGKYDIWLSFTVWVNKKLVVDYLDGWVVSAEYMG